MPEILKTFTNTDEDDFEGMFHGERYIIKAGETRIFSERLARHLAKHFAYKMAVKGGIDKITEGDQGRIAAEAVGSADLPPVPAKAEEPKIEEKPKEEEFADIKPKKTRRVGAKKK